MKKTILLLTASFLSALDGSAQNTSTLGLPGFNNSFGALLTNQSANGLTSGNSLNQLLLNLQADLSQILPVLATANDSFDFTPASANTSASAGIGSTASTSTATDMTFGGASTLLGRTSLGQDLSTLVGGQANAPGSTALGSGVSTAIPPIAGSNGAVSETVSGGIATGPAFTSKRDILRALIILQDDVEQMLPLVNALNGGSASTLNTIFTNNLGSATLTPRR
jgi:hypothetical protein